MSDQGPVRIGIIGLGRAGYGMHAEELRGHEGFRIVAGCDTIESRARKLAEEFGSRAYTDYRELLKDPDVELVAVTTRSDTHARITIDSLLAGKHVLVEKPMALNLAETDRMISAAQQTGNRLLLRQNVRHERAFTHVREIVESGVLGRVFYIRLCRHGFDQRHDWQTLKEFGGGQLNNWGPHIIDHALQLLGGRPVSLWSDLQLVAAAGDAEDHIKIAMRGETGLVLDMEISGGAALGEPHYRVMGTLGALVCDGREITMRYLDPADLEPVTASPETPPEGAGFGSGRVLPWKEQTIPVAPKRPCPPFYDLVYRTMRQGEPFPITLDEARNIMWVIDKAREGTQF